MKVSTLVRRILLGAFLTITLGGGAAATSTASATAAPAGPPAHHADNTIWD